jgi:pimeloyl-ACP methyl ester carboxylesterase
LSTFALVHGAWHGAWCWARLAPELERRGHRTVAVDLPCDDPAATFADYADGVVRALDETDEDVVVVGHSLGGMSIPLVAARRPVRALVYVCALVPIPGASMADQLRAEPDTFVPGYEAGLAPPDESRARRWADFAVAWETMYGDCKEADARWAFERLRPQATGAYRVPCPLGALPPVPSRYVVCAEDRVVDPGRGRRAAAERLGVAPVELPGSHSPYLSRPAALAVVLDEAAQLPDAA